MIKRQSELAQQKINIVAIIGLIVTCLVAIGSGFYNAMSLSHAMGKQSEAIIHVGDGLKDLKQSFDDYKREMGSKVDGVRNDLTAIKGEVRTNSELNKKQVDTYQAEVIATKVVNASLNKMSQSVKVYR